GLLRQIRFPKWHGREPPGQSERKHARLHVHEEGFIGKMPEFIIKDDDILGNAHSFREGEVL
ncbi:MAG: hypothetical protein ACXAEN_17320, partial [Candidatus Thorarchaeota archaeon]